MKNVCTYSYIKLYFTSFSFPAHWAFSPHQFLLRDNSNLPSQHKSCSLGFGMGLPQHSTPSPNTLSFIKLSILFPRLLCLHISIGMEHKWGVEEEADKRGGGIKNTKRSERDISFFHTMCYCKILISSAIPLPLLSPLFFFSITVSVRCLR